MARQATSLFEMVGLVVVKFNTINFKMNRLVTRYAWKLEDTPTAGLTKTLSDLLSPHDKLEILRRSKSLMGLSDQILDDIQTLLDIRANFCFALEQEEGQGSFSFFYSDNLKQPGLTPELQYELFMERYERINSELDTKLA